MSRRSGGRQLKIKTVELKAKHAEALRTSHILSLVIFVLLGFGVLLGGYAYIYNQYRDQQLNNSTARDQLDYGAIFSEPIDKPTFYILTGGMILALVGTTASIFLIVKHNAKHHIYRVASGRTVPVPSRRKGPVHHKSPFAVGQTDESRHQAQQAALKEVPANSAPQSEQPQHTGTIKVNVQ